MNPDGGARGGRAVELTVPDAVLASKWEPLFSDPEIVRDVEEARFAGSGSYVMPFSYIELRDPDLADELLANAGLVIRVGANVLDETPSALTPKPSLHLRIDGLPQSVRVRPRELGTAHLGRLVAVRGIIVVNRPRMAEVIEAAFECKFCGNLVFVPQDDEGAGKLLEPVQCAGCEKSGPWRLRLEQSRRGDVQVLTIQEAPDDIRGRSEPAPREVVVRGDLMDAAWPGETVIVNGIVTTAPQFRGNSQLARHDFEIYGISIEPEHRSEDNEPTPEQLARFHELAARPSIAQELAQCVAPGLHGMETERLGVLLGIVGSNAWAGPGGRPQRGRIHVHLCTDPGMAKSLILADLDSICPIYIRVTGKRSSPPGLVGGLDDDRIVGKKILKPGAMTLAHGGVVAIDELQNMNPNTEACLWDPMADGIAVTTLVGNVSRPLPAEATVVAMSNPSRGRFDPMEPLMPQVSASPQLLSRFDLMFLIADRDDQEGDEAIFDSVGGTAAATKPLLTADELRRWIYAAKAIEPELTAEAHAVLKSFFRTVRRRSEDGAPGVDRRFASVLHRVARATARLCLRDRVEEGHARLALDIIETSLRQRGAMRDDGSIDGSLLTGKTDWTQNERVGFILTIVQRLASEGRNAYATEEEVIETAKPHGIDADGARKALELLRRHGRIYPKGGNGTFAPLAGGAA